MSRFIESDERNNVTAGTDKAHAAGGEDARFFAVAGLKSAAAALFLHKPSFVAERSANDSGIHSVDRFRNIRTSAMKLAAT